MRTTMHFLGYTAMAIAFSSPLAVASGKPTGEPERLANGTPDYHQYEAEIVKIIDADTVRARMHLLPGLFYEVSVFMR